MKLMKTLIVAAAGLALSAATSNATIIASGGSGVPGVDSGTGTLVASLLNQPLFQTAGAGITGQVDGTVSSWVVRGDTSNPYAGGLTFVYQINNTDPFARPIENLALSSFGGLPAVDLGEVGGVNALYAGGLLGTVPSHEAVFSGGTVTFQLFDNGGLGVGSSSYYLVVNTSATGYGSGTGLTEDGFSTAGAILAVPEPTTIVAGALLLLPFGASTLRFARKSRVA